MKKKFKQTKTIRTEDRYEIPLKRGNGILNISILQDESGEVLEYSLAYINTRIFAKDNGRVIGYDNAHGKHHCHRMGKYEIVEFKSFDKISELFEKEWREYHENAKRK